MGVDPNRLQNVLPQPVAARHAEYSMVFSADDEVGRPSERLLAIGIDGAEHARKISLSDLSARLPAPPYYPDIWPGEHYKLLAGLVLALAPKVIIEIGTGSGLSALAMKKFLKPDATLVTFDPVSWDRFPDTVLKREDFADERFVQFADDLSDPLIFPLHLALLRDADLIFVDASKDGTTENRLIKNLSTIPFLNRPIVVFDDIRLWRMLKIWRELRKPKLDLTSFGHWSGTGLVEWRDD